MLFPVACGILAHFAAKIASKSASSEITLPPGSPASQVSGPAGKRNDLSVYTYNPADNSYKFCGMDRTGVPRATPLTIERNIWSYETEQEEAGKKIHIKTINGFIKPSIVTWNTKFTADDGAHWTLMNEGVDTKTR